MSYHLPVLADELVYYLVQGKGLYVDGTVGGGGHAKKILQRLDELGVLNDSFLYGFDKDKDAINYAKSYLKHYEKNCCLIEGGYETADRVLKNSSIKGMMLDLGISSYQINEPMRGFSYRYPEAPLDMRFSENMMLSAKEVLNSFSEYELKMLIKKNSQEPKAGRIASLITLKREKNAFEKVGDLMSVIDLFYLNLKDRVKARSRVFQAIRIEVNQEFKALRTMLEGLEKMLFPKEGRFAVISYHSLEDRIVKHFFREVSSDDWGPKELMIREPIRKKAFKLITKKPIIPTDKEIKKNPRSRSAKLRIIQKI